MMGWLPLPAAHPWTGKVVEMAGYWERNELLRLEEERKAKVQENTERFQVRQNMDGERWNVIDTSEWDKCQRRIISAGFRSKNVAEVTAILLNGGIASVEAVRQTDRDYKEQGKDREAGFKNYGPDDARRLVAEVKAIQDRNAKRLMDLEVERRAGADYPKPGNDYY